MTIVSSSEAGVVTLKLGGRLDFISSSELSHAMTKAIPQASFLVIDCEELEYVSSAGLRVFLAAQKEMKGSMKMVHVNKMVSEILDITGFSSIITVE